MTADTSFGPNAAMADLMEFQRQTEALSSVSERLVWDQETMMPPGAAGIGLLAELGAVFSAVTFLVFAGYAALAASGRDALLSSDAAMRWLRRAFAASFAALGLKLAVARA